MRLQLQFCCIGFAPGSGALASVPTMYEQSAMPDADPSLIPFLRAACEAEQERLLASLISEQAGPLIRKIIRNRLRLRAASQSISHDPESEDVYGEVVVRLLKRLREFKA